jgi:PAS domain S-box-containing protein
VKCVRVVAHPSTSDEPGGLLFFGAVTDITESRRGVEALRRSEQRLRDVIDTIPTMAWTALPDGSIDFVSRSWLEYTGFSMEDWLGKGWKTVALPEDLDETAKKWQRALESGEPYECEVRTRTANGSYRWCLSRAIPLRDESGKIVQWYGTNTDIDERKKAEEKLQRSEAFLAQGQSISHTGSFGWNFVSRETYWSDETYQIYECDRTAKPAFRLTLPRIHPDDRDLVLQTVDRATNEKANFDIEHRLLMPDGRVKHLHVLARAVKTSSGNPELVGAVTDVTAAKQAEEKIRQSERELRQLLDLTPLHITEFAPDGSLLYDNQASLDYHGLTLEEWQSADLNRLLYPEDAERWTRERPGKFQGGSPYEFEARLRRRDAQYRWFLFRLNPMLDEQGRPKRWYAAATDIEDRKQAEQRLQNQNVALREEIDKASMFEEIVGTSSPLQTVLSRISKVASSDSSVLITGETGTGKELVARAIHRRSRRSSRAFVSVNCAAIPRDLIASELFGHEKGAFTGATQRRLGRFELAEGGTIFLDEIGELPAETQIALLHVLQEHEFERLGGAGSIRTNVRVIAATNRDLDAAIAAGVFRSDLFYRLNVFPIEIPPLRERGEDIPLLVEYFIDRYARKAGKSFQGVNKKSLDLLQSYPWPGNIRELQNVIERSVIVCDTENFSVDESWLSRQPLATDPNRELGLFRKLPSQEKAIIEAALGESGGRVYGPSGAAAKLGMPRSTLESKIRSLKINKNRFKATDISNNS